MMGSSCEAQQRSCHRRTRVTSGMDRVVHHSHVCVWDKAVQGVGGTIPLSGALKR